MSTFITMAYSNLIFRTADFMQKKTIPTFDYLCRYNLN